MRFGLLDRNPATDIVVPRVPRKDVEPLSVPQAEQLLKTASAMPLYAFYVLALVTGARRGELLGLKWTDVDLATGRLTITRSLQRVEKLGLQLTETKSRAANRTVILPNFAIAALRSHHKVQLRQRLISGPDWRDGNFIFTARDGQPVEPNSMHRIFKRLLKQAALPAQIRFHDLRHSAASLLIAKGVPLKLTGIART